MIADSAIDNGLAALLGEPSWADRKVVLDHLGPTRYGSWLFEDSQFKSDSGFFALCSAVGYDTPNGLVSDVEGGCPEHAPSAIQSGSIWLVLEFPCCLWLLVCRLTK